MAGIDMSGIKAYSFPDRTTWVGRFDQDAGTLAEVIIFDTPTTETFNGDKVYYGGIDTYLINMYQAKILERRGHQVKEELPTARNFDPSKAIAEWNLHPDPRLSE